MQRLQMIQRKTMSLLVSADQHVQRLHLPYFFWLRWCFTLTYLATFIERFLDADYITKTSLTYLSHLEGSPHIVFFGNLLLSSMDIYRTFLAIVAALSVLYASGRGGIWVPLVFAVSEFIFQTISVGNLYGHEGFIHQFLMLMILVEVGQGRLRHQMQTWNPSRLSGLAILLLRWQLMVLYFMAGLSKILSPDWQSHEILDRIFSNALYNRTFFDSLYADNFWVAPVLKFTLIGFQILFPFLVFIRPLRRWLFMLGILIHTFIAIKMDLYFFSFFVVSLYLLFCEDSCKERISSQKLPLSPSA